MIALLGNGSGKEKRDLMERRRDIGSLVSPSRCLAVDVERCPAYACDNDVFANRTDAGWWFRAGETAWLKMLDRVAGFTNRPKFCVLPDIVGDWESTVARSFRYVREARSRNLPVAIALQDGCAWLEEALLIAPEAVFVGGSRKWKWANVERITAFFRQRGVWVHVGRCSGYRRIQECVRLGVDSCDGTGWMRNPGRELPKLLHALDGTHPQTRMMI